MMGNGNWRTRLTSCCRACLPVRTCRVWRSSWLIGYNGGVKVQFSLFALIVCLTALAIVAALCAQLPVTDYELRRNEPALEFNRSPNAKEAILRMAFWFPLAALAALPWMFRARKL